MRDDRETIVSSSALSITNGKRSCDVGWIFRTVLTIALLAVASVRYDAIGLLRGTEFALFAVLSPFFDRTAERRAIGIVCLLSLAICVCHVIQAFLCGYADDGATMESATIGFRCYSSDTNDAWRIVRFVLTDVGLFIMSFVFYAYLTCVKRSSEKKDDDAAALPTNRRKDVVASNAKASASSLLLLRSLGYLALLVAAAARPCLMAIPAMLVLIGLHLRSATTMPKWSDRRLRRRVVTTSSSSSSPPPMAGSLGDVLVLYALLVLVIEYVTNFPTRPFGGDDASNGSTIFRLLGLRVVSRFPQTNEELCFFIYVAANISIVLIVPQIKARWKRIVAHELLRRRDGMTEKENGEGAHTVTSSKTAHDDEDLASKLETRRSDELKAPLVSNDDRLRVVVEPTLDDDDDTAVTSVRHHRTLLLFVAPATKQDERDLNVVLDRSASIPVLPIACVIAIAWSVAFPSMLALPLLLWSLLVICLTPEATRAMTTRNLLMRPLMLYGLALVVLVYAVNLPSEQSRGIFTDVVNFHTGMMLGLNAHPHRQGRFTALAQLSMLILLNMLTSLKMLQLDEEEEEEDDDERPPSSSMSTKRRDDDDDDDETTPKRKIVVEAEQTIAFVLRTSIRFVVVFLQQKTWIVSLVALFAIALAFVDALHASYIVFAVCFFIVGDRRRFVYWRFLLVYVCFLTVLLYVMSGMCGWTIDTDCAKGETDVYCMIGIDTAPYYDVRANASGDRTVSMWNASFVSQLVALFLVALQQMNFSESKLYKDIAARMRRPSFVPEDDEIVPIEYRGIMRKITRAYENINGSILVVALLLVALGPPVNLVGTFDLVWFFVIAACRYKYFGRVSRKLKHLLRLMIIISIVVFCVRYVCQWPAFEDKIGRKIVPESVKNSTWFVGFDEYAAGFQRFEHPRLLFVYLAGQSLVLALSLIEMKIISKKLKEGDAVPLAADDVVEAPAKEEEDDGATKATKTDGFAVKRAVSWMDDTVRRRVTHDVRLNRKGSSKKKKKTTTTTTTKPLVIKVNLPDPSGTQHRMVCEYVVYDPSAASVDAVRRGIAKAFCPAQTNDDAVVVTFFDARGAAIDAHATPRSADLTTVVSALVREKGSPSLKNRVRAMTSTAKTMLVACFWDAVRVLRRVMPFVTAMLGTLLAFDQVHGLRYVYLVTSVYFLVFHPFRRLRDVVHVLFLEAGVVGVLVYTVQLRYFTSNEHPFWEPGNVTTWMGLGRAFAYHDTEGDVSRADILAAGAGDWFDLFGDMFGALQSEIVLGAVCIFQWELEVFCKATESERRPSLDRYADKLRRVVESHLDNVLYMLTSFALLIAGCSHLSAVSCVYLPICLVFFVDQSLAERWGPRIAYVVGILLLIQYVGVLGLPWLDNCASEGLCSQWDWLDAHPRWQVWLCGIGVVDKSSDKPNAAKHLIVDVVLLVLIVLWRAWMTTVRRRRRRREKEETDDDDTKTTTTATKDGDDDDIRVVVVDTSSASKTAIATSIQEQANAVANALGMTGESETTVHMLYLYTSRGLVLAVFFFAVLWPSFNVLTLVFLVFAIYLLVRREAFVAMMRDDDPEATWMRKVFMAFKVLNWIVLFAHVLYQTPLFDDPDHFCVPGTLEGDGDACLSWGSAFGLHKYNGTCDCDAECNDGRASPYCSEPFESDEQLLVSIILAMLLALQYNIFFNSNGAYEKCRVESATLAETAAALELARAQRAERDVLSNILEKRIQSSSHVQNRLAELVKRLRQWRRDMWNLASGVGFDTKPPEPPSRIRVIETNAHEIVLELSEIGGKKKHLWDCVDSFRIFVKTSDAQPKLDGARMRRNSNVRLTQITSEDRDFPLGSVAHATKTDDDGAVAASKENDENDVYVDEFLYELYGVVTNPDDASTTRRLQIRIGGLHAGLAYDVSVQAVNAAGVGTLSNPARWEEDDRAVWTVPRTSSEGSGKKKKTTTTTTDESLFVCGWLAKPPTTWYARTLLVLKGLARHAFCCCVAPPAFLRARGFSDAEISPVEEPRASFWVMSPETLILQEFDTAPASVGRRLRRQVSLRAKHGLWMRKAVDAVLEKRATTTKRRYSGPREDARALRVLHEKINAALRCPDDEAGFDPVSGVVEARTSKDLDGADGMHSLLRRARIAGEYDAHLAKHADPSKHDLDAPALLRTIDLRRVVSVHATRPPLARPKSYGGDERKRKRRSGLSLADITYPHPRPTQQCTMWLKLKGAVGPLSLGSVARWVPCECRLDVVAGTFAYRHVKKGLPWWTVRIGEISKRTSLDPDRAPSSAEQDEDGADRRRVTIFMSARGQRRLGWRNIKLRFDRDRAPVLFRDMFDPLRRARRWWAVHESRSAARARADDEDATMPWRDITLKLVSQRDFEILHQRGLDCALQDGAAAADTNRYDVEDKRLGVETLSGQGDTTGAPVVRHDMTRNEDDDVLTYETLTLRASSDDDAERWLARLRRSLSSRTSFYVAPASATICALPRARMPELDAGDTKASMPWIRRQMRALCVDSAMYPEPSTGILQQLVRIADSSSLFVAYVMLFVNHAVNQSVLSLPLPSLALCYMLIEYPRPKPRVWRVALIYVCVMVAIKFAWQLPFFCENMSGCDGTECDGSDAYTYSIQPFCLTCGSWISEKAYFDDDGGTCWANETYFAASSYAYDAVQTVNLVGVHKVTAYNSNNEGAFASWFDYVICDVLLIVAILVHISRLQRKGLWLERPRLNTALLSPRNRNRRLVEKDDDDEWAIATTRDYDHEAADTAWTMTAARALPTLVRRVMEHAYCPSALRRFAQRVLWQPQDFYAHWTIASSSSSSKEHTRVLRKRGRNYFPIVFALKIFAFLYIVFLFTNIKENGSNERSKGVSAVLTDTTFSAGTIKASTLLLADIICDAFAFVNEAMWLKIALHVAEVVVVHCWVFFVKVHLPFASNAPLMGFYAIFLAIHLVSCAQIRSGFHLMQQMRLFTTGKYDFKMMDKILFYVYKFVPFVLELNVVLKWACTATAMDLNMWFRLEAIVAKLFIAKCEMVRRQRDGGFLKGRPRKGFEVCIGLIWFIVIIVVLVLPLYFFSSINPYSQANRVVGATAKISIATTRTSGSTLYPLWSSDSSVRIADFSSGDFVAFQNSVLDRSGQKIVLSEWNGQMQSIRLPMPATYTWSLSPPAKAELATTLSGDASLYWRLDATFAHETVSEDATWYAQSPIAESDRDKLVKMIRGEDNATTVVPIYDFYPRVVELLGDATGGGDTSDGSDTNDVDTNVDAYFGATLNLRTANGSSWWESWCAHEDVGSHNPNEINCECIAPAAEKYVCEPNAYAYRNDGIVFNVVWHPVASGIAATLKNTFKATSVITFYATVVLLISSYIRQILWMEVSDIVYYEMPYPDDLLAVCDGITIARHLRHPGHLKDEIGLFNTLIRLYRRPEMLLRITKDKLDPTKDKLE